jgi:hypothetical protein
VFPYWVSADLFRAFKKFKCTFSFSSSILLTFWSPYLFRVVQGCKKNQKSVCICKTTGLPFAVVELYPIWDSLHGPEKAGLSA